MMNELDEFLDLVNSKEAEEEEISTLHEYVEMDIHQFAELFPDVSYLKIGDEYEDGKIVEIEEVSIFIDFYQIAYLINTEEGIAHTYYEGFDLDKERVIELLNDEDIATENNREELMKWLEELNILWTQAAVITDPVELEQFFTKSGYTVIITE